MNKIDYPELELAKKLQGIPFIELAKKNGCEHELEESFPMYYKEYSILEESRFSPFYMTPSRFLLWDALPDWIKGDFQYLLARIRDILHDYEEVMYSEILYFSENIIKHYKLIIDSRGYEQTKALAELWIFLKENNLIEVE